VHDALEGHTTTGVHAPRRFENHAARREGLGTAVGQQRLHELVLKQWAFQTVARDIA